MTYNLPSILYKPRALKLKTDLFFHFKLKFKLLERFLLVSLPGSLNLQYYRIHLWLKAKQGEDNLMIIRYSDSDTYVVRDCDKGYER